MNYVDSNIELFAIIETYGRSYVDLSEVVCLTADGTCSWIALMDGRRVLTTKNLGYYQSILPKVGDSSKNAFFRIHHKHIVNLRFLEKYDRRFMQVIIRPDISVPIAQRRLKSFKNALQELCSY